MARRYGRKTKKRAKKHHRKSPKRVRAGKKAWRTRQRRYGLRAHKRSARRARGHHRRRFGAGGHGGIVSRCMICRRTIFGGRKGMDTHFRRHHPAHGGNLARHRLIHDMSPEERARYRHQRRVAKRLRRQAQHLPAAPVVVQPTGFSPELRARLLAMKAAREAQARQAGAIPLPG